MMGDRDVEWWSWEVVCDAPAEVHFSRLRDARRVLVPGASVGQSLVGTQIPIGTYLRYCSPRCTS